MARSDLVIDLIEAERLGDKARFRSLVETVLAEGRAKSHHLGADRLAELITTSGVEHRPPRDAAAGAVGDLLDEIVPQHRLADLTLDPAVRSLIDLAVGGGVTSLVGLDGGSSWGPRFMTAAVVVGDRDHRGGGRL